MGQYVLRRLLPQHTQIQSLLLTELRKCQYKKNNIERCTKVEVETFRFLMATIKSVIGDYS